MKKTFELELNGMTNSARAVSNDDTVNITTLLEMEGLSQANVAETIKCAIEAPEYAEHFLKVQMAKIYNVYQVAKGWCEEGEIKRKPII